MLKKAGLVIVGITVGFTFAAVAGPYEDGLDAYNRGDIATAVELWKPAAEHGEARAQDMLAGMYFAGYGVTKDEVAGLNLYRKAAAQGNTDAQTQLGNICWNGNAGVTKDPATAVSWWRKAAALGDGDAELNLGKALETGVGVAQNYGESAKWFLKSAKKGLVEAQLKIGQDLTNGRGIQQDDVRAYMWMDIAAQSVSKNDGRKALDTRVFLSTKMTSNQIKRAEMMSKACMYSEYKHCD